MKIYQPLNRCMLILNGGSSSIKFAVYNTALRKLFAGGVEKIGEKNCRLTIEGQEPIPLKVKDIKGAAGALLQYLQQQQLLTGTTSVTHRIVHGMHITRPQVITAKLLKQLKSFIQYDPDHLPGELALVEAVKKYLPRIKQVACFDTAFHSHISQVAAMLPIPRKYYRQGIKKYGFHGLSYAYIMHQLGKLDKTVARGRVIIAHLGNGASMAAVNKGKCMDTSMGFTPTGGFIMGTRTGDIDPGVAWHLIQNEKLTPADFNTLINKQSGLLGVSGISADMQTLVEKQGKNQAAKQAVDLFCYQVKKYIGSYAAILNGIDALVFTGGIGEHAFAIRAAICKGMDYLGLSIDTAANNKNKLVISAPGSSVKVYVIPTDEAFMMARFTKQLLAKQQ